MNSFIQPHFPLGCGHPKKIPLIGWNPFYFGTIWNVYTNSRTLHSTKAVQKRRPGWSWESTFSFSKNRPCGKQTGLGKRLLNDWGHSRCTYDVFVGVIYFWCLGKHLPNQVCKEDSYIVGLPSRSFGNSALFPFWSGFAKASSVLGLLENGKTANQFFSEYGCHSWALNSQAW